MVRTACARKVLTWRWFNGTRSEPNVTAGKRPAKYTLVPVLDLVESFLTKGRRRRKARKRAAAVGRPRALASRA